MVSDLFIWFSLAAASLYIIMSSAGYIIGAISDYAKKTGISDYLIGFLVLSLGTSLPEITTAVIASFTDNSLLLLGDLIGGNIMNMTITLGLTAIVGRQIFVHGKVLNKTIFSTLAIAALPIVVGFDGYISRLEGFFLLGAFGFYMYRLIREEDRESHLKSQIKWSDIWQDMAVVTGTLIALLLSTNWLIISSNNISRILHIDPFITGLILVSAGTTTPELTVNIKSALKGVSGIAFGDLMGSIVNNSTLILGLAAVLKPIRFDRVTFLNSAFFMLTAVYIAMLFIRKKSINWQEGIGLIFIYLTFLVSQGILNFIPFLNY